MIEIFLAAFICFFTPIPWVIGAVHVLILKKRRHVNAKILLAAAAAFVWLGLGYWTYQNYLTIFSHQFHHPLTQFLGVVILLAAAVTELLTSRALGTKRIFGSSELKQTHEKLITSGIYRYARHPRYVEHPCWFLGLGLLFGYPFLLWFALYLFISFTITAYFEERELIQRYGQEYIDYKKNVPAFFVGVI